MVYIKTRDANFEKVEVPKGHTLIQSVCALNVGTNSPTFACLEVDYYDDTMNKVSNPKTHQSLK